MSAKGMKYGESKYKETMPSELVYMMSQGGSRSAFTCHHKISSKTFEVWLGKHKEFAEAYETGREAARQYYEKIAKDHMVIEKDGARVDSKLWELTMRNMFHLTEQRRIKLEALENAKTTQEQIAAVIAELSTGNISGAEAVQMAKLIETGMKVNDSVELEKRVAEIERASKSGFDDSEFKEES